MTKQSFLSALYQKKQNIRQRERVGSAHRPKTFLSCRRLPTEWKFVKLLTAELSKKVCLKRNRLMKKKQRRFVRRRN